MIIAHSILSLVLHFDGSLRPPRDPIPGFTRYTPKSQDMDKIASCSAAMFTEPDDDMSDAKLHSIGGKLLDLMPGVTSADAEYEGLVMGLEELVGYLSEDQNIGSLFFDADEPALIVRGDCKVIIDQFNGRSAPRKMESKYNTAMDKLRSIRELYAAHSKKVDASQSRKKLSIRFEHIPREGNQLCDAICRLLVNQKQRSSVASIYNSILLGENKLPDVSTKPTNTSKGSKSKKNSTNNINFQKALDGIRSTEPDTQLCHSSQLALACKLMAAALQQKDVTVLDELADFFLLMSRRWTRIYYFEDHNTRDVKKSLARVSLLCKDLSSQYLKHGSQEGDVNDKSDVLIEMLQSLAGFLTNSKFLDDVDNSDGVQFPFVDISGLLVDVDEKHWQGVLEQWDRFASESIKEDISALKTGVWVLNAHSLPMIT